MESNKIQALFADLTLSNYLYTNLLTDSNASSYMHALLMTSNYKVE